ncbi:GcrA cell cycle regulator [Bradyrhizobium sp. NFR13]|uniref:GcrA family cell cycle regulator n=1 Tax=Bradyrhizobium sp. NFR13 TaxID=1566285 RepID=UPI0008DF6AA7|nr:GcrA family cell cycle regulator [Bradyrhizobium sp. NFR13]SFM00129.1 GcrA cell cycle regulator [Bradyrhizobium sp. NFR13]
MTKPMEGRDMRGDPKWTPEQDIELRRLLELGRSYTAVAEQINADFGTTFSRNAAIGRGHRLGIKTDRRGLPGAGRKPTGRKPRAVKPSAKPLPFKEPEPLELAPPFAGSLSLEFADLRPFSTEQVNQCRFPEGEGPAFLYCGNPTAPGASWCGHCHEKAHQPDSRPKFRATRSLRGQGAANFSRSFAAA